MSSKNKFLLKINEVPSEANPPVNLFNKHELLRTGFVAEAKQFQIDFKLLMTPGLIFYTYFGHMSW